MSAPFGGMRSAMLSRYGPAFDIGFDSEGASERMSLTRWRDSFPARRYSVLMGGKKEDVADALLLAVGARVRDLREAARMSPVMFARAANITLPYVWRLEGGQQNLSLRSISRIALALGVPMAALLEGIDPDPSTLEKRAWKPRGREGEVEAETSK